MCCVNNDAYLNLILRRFVIQVGECFYNQRHGTIRASKRARLTNHPDVPVGACWRLLLCVSSLRLDRMAWVAIAEAFRVRRMVYAS